MSKQFSLPVVYLPLPLLEYCFAMAVIYMAGIQPEGSLLRLFLPINGHSSRPVSIVVAHPCKYLWSNNAVTLQSSTLLIVLVAIGMISIVEF